MTKRAFLELVSGLVGWPALAPLAAWAQGDRLTNWAGNLEYGTAKLHAARSLDDVREFVRKQSKLKVLGTRHCFNTIADSAHGFLSLGEMGEVVALDTAARTVTVGAGMRYGHPSHAGSSPIDVRNRAAAPVRPRSGGAWHDHRHRFGTRFAATRGRFSSWSARRSSSPAAWVPSL